MVENTENDERTPVEARWNQIRSAIRARWTEITADDLRSIDGDSRRLVALVNQKTGMPLHEIEAAIDDLAASSGGLLNRLTVRTQVFATDVARQVGRPAQAAGQSVRTAVSKSPSTSIATIFGAGFLVGLGITMLLQEPQSKTAWTWKR